MKFRTFDPVRALATLSFTIVSITSAACSTNVTNNPAGPTGPGSTPVPTADCTSRCEAKATKCGAPSAAGKEACAKICDGTYTADQLSCLEDKSCNELRSADFSRVCPSSSGGGGNTSSGGGGDHFSCSLNGQCFKCNDSAGVQKCSITTGPGPDCTKTDSSYCE